jgi:hypothetical protein
MTVLVAHEPAFDDFSLLIFQIRVVRVHSRLNGFGCLGGYQVLQKSTSAGF